MITPASIQTPYYPGQSNSGVGLLKPKLFHEAPARFGQDFLPPTRKGKERNSSSLFDLSSFMLTLFASMAGTIGIVSLNQSIPESGSALDSVNGFTYEAEKLQSDSDRAPHVKAYLAQLWAAYEKELQTYTSPEEAFKSMAKEVEAALPKDSWEKVEKYLKLTQLAQNMKEPEIFKNLVDGMIQELLIPAADSPEAKENVELIRRASHELFLDLTFDKLLQNSKYEGVYGSLLIILICMTMIGIFPRVEEKSEKAKK